MKQTLSTFCKLCWTYIRRMVLKVRLWWTYLRQMGIKKQINRLESGKSSDVLPPSEWMSGDDPW